jgi:hypothetical protein
VFGGRASDSTPYTPSAAIPGTTLGAIAAGNSVAPSAAIPKFDGFGDPLSWLNRCEHYFHIRRTLDHKRVSYALFYFLDDAQLWYHHLELNGGAPPWPEFTCLINTQFRPSMIDTPLGELTLLCHTGSVTEFCT